MPFLECFFLARKILLVMIFLINLQLLYQAAIDIRNCPKSNFPILKIENCPVQTPHFILLVFYIPFLPFSFTL